MSSVPSARSSLTRLRHAGFAALALAAAASAAATYTWNEIQFGGFVSQGYLVNSGHNDYLGETSEGTFDFREYAVNGSWSKGKFRIGAQVFGQKLGDYGDDKIGLDWGTVDYQPTQWFGLRAGRVKMPRGLYNEALDLDSIRPFVLLPQSVYDARLRDFNASFDGAMVFGNVGLGHAGSADYRLFYGKIPISIDSGASDYFNNDVSFPNLEIGMDSVRGGSLFWNAPVTGLRAGYSYSEFENFGALRDVHVMDFHLQLWKQSPKYRRHLLSAEYIRGDWTFAAEIGVDEATYNLFAPGQAPLNQLDAKSRQAYFSVARRLTAKWEVGSYVSWSRETSLLRVATDIFLPAQEQTDYAISLRHDVNEHLLFKVEAHYLEGVGKIFDTTARPQPYLQRDEYWQLLAVKATYSF